MNLTSINFVDLAETAISLLTVYRNGQTRLLMTTSKIRNLLSLISELYNDTVHLSSERLNIDLQSRVQYLKMRMAYESGRDGDVRQFIEKSNLMVYLDEIGDSKENLILYCKYMEALVAYHKYYGGKD